MQQGLKQRLVGALVILALVVIFLPMLLQGPVERTRVDVPIQVPPEPDVGAEDALPPPDFVDQPSPGSGSADARASDRNSRADSGSGQADGGDGAETDTAPDSRPESTTASSDPEAGETAAAEDAAESADADVSEDTAPDGRPGSWVVQVGAFSDASNAERLRERLADAGFEDAYRDQSRRDGDVLHRVRLGPVAERSDAEAVLERLKSSLELDGILVPR